MLGKDVREVPADVMEAAQKIWFAGLGAMALAQEETSRLFAALVEKGEEMEKAGETPIARVKGAAGTAEESWKRIQALIDAQVTAALHRLGVPTRDEIAELGRRIEQLTASIEALKARS